MNHNQKIVLARHCYNAMRKRILHAYAVAGLTFPKGNDMDAEVISRLKGFPDDYKLVQESGILGNKMEPFVRIMQ